MHQARVHQLADDEAGATGVLKLVHIGRAVRIDPRQQRRDGGQAREIIPVDGDAGGTRHGHPVNQVVGGAARGEQGHHGVDDAALVDQPTDGCVVPPREDGQ